jgi:hypothetical protein
MSSFWKLPGADRFIESIQKSLKSGKNVVLLFPQHPPPDFLKTVKTPFSETCELEWHQVQPQENGTLSSPPIHFLIDHFVSAFPENSLKNVSNLCKQKTFQSKLISCHFSSKSQWSSWKEFFTEYGLLSQNQPLLQRTLFLIVLTGSLSADPPPLNAGLLHCRWDGFIDEIDMMVYSSSHLQNEGKLPPLHKRLKISLLTQLSLWDAELCNVLLKEPLSVLCDPLLLLKKFAQQRQWDQLPATQDSATLWSWGVLQTMEGTEYYHSAYLAQIDAIDEIKRRLWRAQIQVLFPYLEEQRQKLLKAFGSFLEAPSENTYTSKDINDLEFSHIVSQIKDKEISVQPKYWKTLNQLKRIRDCLAHFELAATDLLLDPNLLMDL